MGIKEKCNFPWEKFPPPLIFITCSLIFAVVSISLGGVAMAHDAKWNNDYRDHIMRIMKNETTMLKFKNGTRLYTEEEYNLFFRDTWMKKAYMALMCILLIGTIIHAIIYAVYHEEHYRYNFTLVFAFVAGILYLGAGVFMITSTVRNSNNIIRVHDSGAQRARAWNVTFARTTYQPLIHACEAFKGDANEAHRRRLFANTTIEEMRRKARAIGICQLASIKYAAGFFAIFNIFFMCGIFLTTRSKKESEENEYQYRRDLDYDENDPDWTCKLTTYKSRPRRWTELEKLKTPKFESESNLDPAIHKSVLLKTVEIASELPESPQKIEASESSESKKLN